MKKFAAMLLGLSLVLGSTAAFAGGMDEPVKTEKSKKKGKGSSRTKKNEKRKAEEPKAQ